MPRLFDLHFRVASIVLCCACFAAFLLFGTSALAQQSAAGTKTPSVIEGRVCDPAGSPIAGAVVRLEPQFASSSEDQVSAVKTTTNEQGKYILEAAAGHFALRVTALGFRVLVMNDVLLKPTERLRIDLVLQVGWPGPVVDALPPSQAAPPVEFSDAPNFTVAGITDRSNMGLHGSDANTRTSDALARETTALKSRSTGKGAASGAGDAHRLAGDANEKNGDPLGAVKEYQAAVNADPSEQNYFAWGSELLVHRAGQAAVQVFSAGAKAHPASSRMRAGLGAAYYSNGQYNEAASQLCRASDLSPTDSAPYLFLGKMEQAAADPLPCSDLALSRFATTQPQNPQANFFYGLVLWKKARKTQDAASLARAEQLFRRAVELQPDFAEVYLQLGMLYNARGEKDSALASFEKAVDADPKSSAAHYQLSLAYRRSGDAAKADLAMKTYDDLRRSEDAALAKERRELRQFVTILQDGKSLKP